MLHTQRIKVSSANKILIELATKKREQKRKVTTPFRYEILRDCESISARTAKVYLYVTLD